MVRAKIIGGFHHSSGQRKREESELEDGDYDAVFRENRKYYFFPEDGNLSFGYIIYLFGLVEWLGLVKLSYSKRERFYSIAEEKNIQIFDNIDLSFPKVYEHGKGLLKVVFYFVLFFVSVWLIFFYDTYDPMTSTLAGLILLIFSPFLYFVTIVLSANDEREEHISRSIIEKIREKNYQNVLIICGDKHVPKIRERLMEENIEVVAEEKGSFSFIKSLWKLLLLVILIILLFLFVYPQII